MKKTIFPILFAFIALQSYSQVTVKRIQDLPSETPIDTSSITICIDDSTSPSSTWRYKKVSFGQIQRQFTSSPGSGYCSSCDTVITDTITSAQILNSYSSTDTLLPAPGVGWQWIVTNIQAAFIFVSSPYTSTNSCFYQGDTATSLGISANQVNILNGTTNSFFIKYSLGSQNSISYAGYQTSTLYNQPVTFYTQTSNPTGGDGYLVVTIIAKKTH